MTIRLTHARVSVVPDSNDGKVSSDAWNDAHAINGSPNMLVGFDGTGVGAEINPATITSGSVVDGDKGEVTIASGVWSLDANAVNIVNKAQHVADRTALSTAGTGIPVAYLREAGREGVFVWSSANLSANVTADTRQGIYVAPAAAPTGASGAWVRKYTGATNVLWFGAVGDRLTDDYAAIQGAINTVLAVGGGTVYLPGGKWYRQATGLIVTSATDSIVPICIEGGPASYLEAITAIDMLTISNTGVAPANTRFVSVKNLGFVANHASARGLVLSNASYNQFTGLDMMGTGTAITCGSVFSERTIGNQFDNIRITSPGNGILISGTYNIFTNIQINEGITGQYAIKFHGQYCVVDGFVARGVGGTGGTATVEMTSFAAGCTLANGTVFDSYAVGVHVQGADGQKVKGVSIFNSQTHGLQLSGCNAGEFDVTIINSSLATADTYNHINCLNTPTSCTIRAQFVGTQPLLDINEANGTNNVWTCGTLPNGKTISGTSTVVVSAGNIRAASYNVGATQVFNTSGVLQAAAFPALTSDVTTAGGSLATTIAAGAVSLAKMANLAANSILGNNTGSSATPLALTAAQTKTLLAIANTDVSGLGTASTAATGTSGHTLPFLDGANTFSNDLTIFQHNLFLNDVSAFGAFGGNGNGRGWATTVGGFNLAGQGSSYDLSLTNKSGTTAIRIPTGTTNAEVVGSLAVGGITVFNSSGVLQAAAFPALTGDVTTSAGALATTVANNAVTYAKFQQVAASSLVGNATGSLANATGITLAGGLAFSGSTLTAAGALTPTSVASTGAITSSSATGGVGYATGAGGAVTQLTSKSTAPPAINKVCGQITMNNAALAAAAKVSFAVSNTSCAATDIPQVAVVSGGTANAYRANVTAVAANSFTVTVENITAGSLSEAPVIGFFINKAVTS